jgi:hypothetical protein
MMFQDAIDTVENLKINWDIMKDAHSKAKKDHKKKKDNDPPHTAVVAAKTAIDKVRSAWDEAGAKAEVIGTQIFQLYVNLLSSKSCQSWDKIIKAHTRSPLERISREKCMTKRESDLGVISPLHDLSLLDHVPA